MEAQRGGAVLTCPGGQPREPPKGTGSCLAPRLCSTPPYSEANAPVFLLVALAELPSACSAMEEEEAAGDGVLGHIVSSPVEFPKASDYSLLAGGCMAGGTDAGCGPESWRTGPAAAAFPAGLGAGGMAQ